MIRRSCAKVSRRSWSLNPIARSLGRRRTESMPSSRPFGLAPAVVLMDIRMPRLDGVEATRRVCSDQRWTGRVIVLTTYGADENVWDAFHAGASGFLLKTTTAGELVHAVRSVAAGTELLASEVTRRLVR